jgi:hypothetical protein
MKNQNLRGHSRKSEGIPRLYVLVVLTLGIPLLGSMPLQAQDSCQPVNDAMHKIYTTPTHLSTTMMGVGEPVKNELIYAGGVIYENVHGKWSHGGVTLQQVMKMEEENRRNSKTACRYLRDEPVNGEAAAVYSTHAERSAPAVKSDGQIWISKTKGLPLRHEEDIDAGSGTKMHHSTRYEYTNVRPPL